MTNASPSFYQESRKMIQYYPLLMMHLFIGHIDAVYWLVSEYFTLGEMRNDIDGEEVICQSHCYGSILIAHRKLVDSLPGGSTCIHFRYSRSRIGDHTLWVSVAHHTNILNCSVEMNIRIYSNI